MRQLIPLFLIACFCSCGPTGNDFSGKYSAAAMLDEYEDSGFIELIRDSVVIFTSYRTDTDYSVVNIAIAQLRRSNDTLYASMKYPRDTMYCDRVVHYADEQGLFKPGIDLGCIVWSDTMIITDAGKGNIKLMDDDRVFSLKKIK